MSLLKTVLENLGFKKDIQLSVDKDSAINIKSTSEKPIVESLMPTLETTDVEGLGNVLVQQTMYCCADNEPTGIHFTTHVEVPVGFRIHDDGNLFATSLTLDQNTLDIIEVEVYKPTEVYISEYNRSIECNVPIVQIRLVGDLNYNQEVEGFEAVEKLEGQDNTMFSSADVTPMNVELGYCCKECVGETALRDYTIDLIKDKTFVVDCSGQKYDYDPLNTTPFFNVLKQGNCTRMLSTSYTLLITPFLEPAS